VNRRAFLSSLIAVPLAGVLPRVAPSSVGTLFHPATDLARAYRCGQTGMAIRFVRNWEATSSRRVNRFEVLGVLPVQHLGIIRSDDESANSGQKMPPAHRVESAK